MLVSAIKKWCPSCGVEHDGLQNQTCVDCLSFQRKHGSRLGGVYFVRSGDFIKIGVASNVLRRVEVCWSWNPHEFSPIGWIPTPDDDECGYTIERRLHQQFTECRHRGEWFHATQALTDYIAAHAQPWPIKRVR